MLKKSTFGASRRWFLKAATGVGVGLANWGAAARGLAGDPVPEANASTTPAGPGEQGTRSPTRFSGPAPDPSEIADAVERSLQHLITRNVDVVFPMPFEVVQLRQDAHLRDQVLRLVIDQLTRSEGRGDFAEPVHAVITPKAGTYEYLSFAHIEMLDLLQYLACAILIAKYTEPMRISADAKRVFSYRFTPDGVRLFDDGYDYQAFHDQISLRLKSEPGLVLVGADIADFYGSVDNQRVGEILLGRGVPPWLVVTLGDLLLRWRRQGRRGLPVGPHASRIVAETALLDVDAKLVKDDIDFVRFVDDYRLFTPDIPTARRWLERLIEHLSAEGLSLNNAKTTVDAVTGDEYEALIAARRAASIWGSVALQHGRIELGEGFPPPGSLAQLRFEHAMPNRPTPFPRPTPRMKLPPIRRRYGEASPFRKVALNVEDVSLLDIVDPAIVLTQLRQRSETEASVDLGHFRLFVEASLYRDEPALLADVFEFLGRCPHCIPYLIDVLVEESEQIPVSVRTTARRWFAGRLASHACATELEILHVARLLGADGYRDPAVVYSYLRSTGHASSPIVARELLAALDGQYDVRRAASLIDLCERTSPFVRRAALNVAWPDLDPEKKSVALNRHRAEFDRDPFLAALLRTP